MTLAELIRELQALDVGPNTPVRFYANEHDADEPLINLLQISSPRRSRQGGRQEVGFHVHSDELEEILESELLEW